MSLAGERLEGKVRAVRAHLARQALTAGALWGGAAVGSALGAAWLLVGPGGWRQGSALPLALDLGMFGVGAGTAMGMRVLVARRLGGAALARTLEQSAGLRAGVVQGALELHHAVPGGVSGALVEKAVAQAADALGAPASVLSGALGVTVRGWRRRGVRALAAVVVGLVLLGVARPHRAARAWAGLSSPLRTLAKPVLPPLTVLPGTVAVPRGEDVEVRVEAPGRSTAELWWHAAGDVPRAETVAMEGGIGVKVFPALSVTVEYSARTADGAASETYRLVPVDPLFISELRVEVAYPAHTGMPPEEHRGSVPPLHIPEGTRLLVEGVASRALSRAAVLAADGSPAADLSVEGGRFSGVWRPTRDGSYRWSIVDAAGEPASSLPEPLVVSLVPDAAPSVSIPLPGRDTLLALSLTQPLILEAHDDYGLGRLELVAYRIGALGERGEPVAQGLELGGARSALARPLLDVSRWNLLPGDEVRYFARVRDNAPGAHVARSEEFALRMPDASALRRGAEAELRAVSEKLAELATEAQRKAEETRDLQREAAAGRPEDAARTGSASAESGMGFEQREELSKALEGQEGLGAEVDSLRSELEALQRALENAGAADPELRRDLQELQELLQQIAGAELERRMDEVAQGLERQGAREASQSLQELAREQERFRDRLQASLEQFRRAAVEQDFRATQEDMDELARKERALADALREGDRPELRAEQQGALERDAEELRARMERLGGRLEELAEKEAAQEVAGAGERTRDAQARMGEAREQAGRSESRSAAQTADQAAAEVERAAEQMERAQAQMAQEQAQAALEALRTTADDALALARAQSRLRAAIGRSAPEALPAFRGDEASLGQGVRNIAQNLQAAAKGILGANQEMTAQIGRALEAIERSVQSLEGHRPAGQAPAAAATQAVDDLNQLALMALAGAEQMSAQQSQGEGGRETAEELQQLAQQQGQMVNKAGQLTPLQLGEQALREQVERLAREQQSVAEDLEELSERDRAQEEALGDLERMAAEAEAVAEALARGRLTPETLQRQERLFHRLLDAGRSLQKEDEDTSDERESRTPGAFERAGVVPLGSERLGALRYEIPGPDELQRLPPAVRQLVLQYFERLNRIGGTGGGL